MTPGSTCTPSTSPYRIGTATDTGPLTAPAAAEIAPVATPIAAHVSRTLVESRDAGATCSA